MPPAIIDAMTVFRQQLLNNETRAQARMVSQWITVEQSLQAKVESTVERIADLQRQGVTIRQWRVMELNRYQDLVSQSRAEIRYYVIDTALPVVRARQRDLVEMGMTHANVAHNVLGVSAQYNRLPTSVIRNLTAVAGDGSPLRDLLMDSYGERESDNILDMMIRGVARGQNPKVIARDVVRHGYSQSLTRMLTTMRTEPLRAYRESSRQSYIRSGVVIGYKRLAAYDTRTCPGCLMASGEFLGLDVAFEMHPNCRCTLVPVLSTETEWETGEEWFLRQDEATQRTILGPGRYDAWQDGQFELNQLVKRVEDTTWGTSIQTTPLYELTQ